METVSTTEQLPEKQAKRTNRWRWVALFVVSMAIFLDALDVSIVNVALPNIQRDLQLTTTQLQWVPGVYLLTYAGFQLLGGRTADLLGRRVFLMGVTLFGLASLSGGLARSEWLLILSRGVQGIGAALTFPSAVSILTTTFAEGLERNKALGIFSAMGAAGFTCGLVLGGLLTTFISWRWVFFVNVPVVLFVLGLSRIVPEGRSMGHTRSYDLAGTITITGGLLLLVYAITQANESGTIPLKAPGLFALALLILVCFILIERRSKAPLIPARIWRSSTLGAASAASLLLSGSFSSFLFIYTLYLQEVLHCSPVNTSLILLPASIASVLVGLILAPWFMNRLGLGRSSGLGLLCLASGIALFTRIGANGDYVGIILPGIVLAMSGAGLAGPTLAVAAVSGIKPTEQGLATGLQGTSLQAGGGLGLAITAVVVAVPTALGHGATQISAPEVLVRLSGYHMGLLVALALAALGGLIALLGIKIRPEAPSNASHED